MSPHRTRIRDAGSAGPLEPGPRHLEQIASQMQRLIQVVLGRGLHDPRLRGLISVTRVDVAPDLSQAAVHVSVLPAAYGSAAVQGLQHAAPKVRAEVGRGMRLRRMPPLVFELDESIKRQAELEAAIEHAVSPEEPVP